MAINGTAGNDTLTGTVGDDLIYGFAGIDFIYGDPNINITLSWGNDTLYGGDDTDYLYGGDGTIRSDDGADVLFGGPGNDVLHGNANDTLYGGFGNDTFYGYLNNNQLYGGAGDDIYYLYDPTNTIIEFNNEGIDTVYVSFNYTLPANVEILRLNGTATSGTGNELNNTISYFGSSNVILDGRSGNDSISGGSGNDTLIGGSGDDYIFGSDGNDILRGGGGTDRIKGGFGRDYFSFDINSAFSATVMGIDTIEDFFSSQGDLIVLDKTTFTGLTSAVGNGFSVPSEFAVVSSDAAAGSSNALITYNSTNGNLFYNQNGSAAGFGTGGQFALFSSLPSLTANMFYIQQ